MPVGVVGSWWKWAVVVEGQGVRCVPVVVLAWVAEVGESWPQPLVGVLGIAHGGGGTGSQGLQCFWKPCRIWVGNCTIPLGVLGECHKLSLMWEVWDGYSQF